MRAALLVLTLSLAGCHQLLPFRGEASGHADAASDHALERSRVEGGRDHLPGDLGAPWRTIVSLPSPITICPPGWIFDAEISGCANPSHDCSTTNQAALQVQIAAPYSEIRGRLRGRQRFSTDAFNTGFNTSLESAYVEGVSICRVDAVGKRQHVHTLAVGLTQAESSGSCPCFTGAAPPPSFVGTAWTCDSGNPGPSWEDVWYPRPLWGDEAWMAGSGGCVHPAPAALWSFEVVLPAPTTDALEVRILYDDCDENVGITELRLEVR